MTVSRSDDMFTRGPVGRQVLGQPAIPQTVAHRNVTANRAVGSPRITPRANRCVAASRRKC